MRRAILIGKKLLTMSRKEKKSAIRIETRSSAETQEMAKMLAETIAATSRRRAVVVGLQGELGAGKTTFAQGFARALGVTERVLSPTFVLMKIYPLKKGSFRRLVHIDCYRITSPKDITPLGLTEILKDPETIVLIEWPERMRKTIPRDALWLEFFHGAQPRERRITMEGFSKALRSGLTRPHAL